MSKPSRLVLVPSDAQAEALLSDSRTTLVHLTDELCVLEIADRTLADTLQESRPGWSRIFEEYHLANTHGDRAQGVLVSAFFDWLTDRYNNEIDQSRNLRCYEELFGIANELREIAGEPALLDLGCGPGTILGSCVARSTQDLVGYDISEIARRAAASAGMTVMSREEFLSRTARFDVALSAYTMHYACNIVETLMGVECNLKSGGIWALNFHKGIGLDAFLAHLDFTALGLATPVRASTYGAIVAVRRR